MACTYCPRLTGVLVDWPLTPQISPLATAQEPFGGWPKTGILAQSLDCPLAWVLPNLGFLSFLARHLHGLLPPPLRPFPSPPQSSPHLTIPSPEHLTSCFPCSSYDYFFLPVLCDNGLPNFSPLTLLSPSLHIFFNPTALAALERCDFPAENLGFTPIDSNNDHFAPP